MSIHLPPDPFSVPHGGIALHGDRYSPRCGTVVLHGAGTSSRERFQRLRAALNAHGMPSVGFDFVGHGQTGGSLLGSTLKARTEQAAAVIRHSGREPLCLVGASMSGHTAIRLTPLFRVESLVLLVPAVYAAKAYRIPFGPEFSAAIRVPGSWKDSEVFDILSEFRGSLLVIAAEADAIIPPGVAERIVDSALSARNRRLHIVPGSGHLSLFPTERDFLAAVEMIVNVRREGEKY